MAQIGLDLFDAGKIHLAAVTEVVGDLRPFLDQMMTAGVVAVGVLKGIVPQALIALGAEIILMGAEIILDLLKELMPALLAPIAVDPQLHVSQSQSFAKLDPQRDYFALTENGLAAQKLYTQLIKLHGTLILVQTEHRPVIVKAMDLAWLENPGGVCSTLMVPPDAGI
jgi:hypothetical protein